ncbi:MAG: hypothetical protein NT126_01925 [Bacteroidetes bacterium]|nr:hypothetical protein [Bacteroidota bacterium]
MNRQSIHQQVDLLLKTLAEQHEKLKSSSGTIPHLELDIILQNTRQLYEAILLLNHHNALSSLDEVKAAVTQRILAEKRMFEKKTEESLKATQEKKEPEKEIHPPVTMEEVMVKTSAAEEAETKKEKAIKPKKISGGVNVTLFGDAHSLGDNFHDEETVHEHIAAKASSKTVAEKLHHKPIVDLKAAIGINEKFLFINQLFDGNLQDYSEAIDKINNAGNLDAAKQLIAADLASRFNWPDQDEHVKHFKELVERRFIS